MVQMKSDLIAVASNEDEIHREATTNLFKSFQYVNPTGAKLTPDYVLRGDPYVLKALMHPRPPADVIKVESYGVPYDPASQGRHRTDDYSAAVKTQEFTRIKTEALGRITAWTKLGTRKR
ncbi:uncharacterized protein PV07_08700 [Cladophialophora immunda]|uniref:Uncharacterized protein n=1 Tax=Cladophialophora immunda TaxID=569365 RepID=A0A0D2CPR2_9EURO|nr:uncharacterized protein PV07_08700 [Cladophialophora immunda]KIW25534.1 hypothetical protein PV07_08700 [Cladophialophora immunda]